MKKYINILWAILSLCYIALGSAGLHADDQKNSVFVGYELNEMVLNEFNKFAGEVGYRFRKEDQVRLSYMDVVLTERHLSGSEASAVDGDNVEGKFQGWELSYDRFLGLSSWYLSVNAGHFRHLYQHTVLDDELDFESHSLGIGFGYFDMNHLGVDGLTLNISVPIRKYLKPQDKTYLGDTRINAHSIVNNFWFFIGYAF